MEHDNFVLWPILNDPTRGFEIWAWVAESPAKQEDTRPWERSQFKAVLDTEFLEEGEKSMLESCIFDLFSSLTAPWEERHRGLMAAGILVPTASKRFCDLVKGEIPLLLQHKESRIHLHGVRWVWFVKGVVTYLLPIDKFATRIEHIDCLVVPSWSSWLLNLQGFTRSHTSFCWDIWLSVDLSHPELSWSLD